MGGSDKKTTVGGAGSKTPVKPVMPLMWPGRSAGSEPEAYLPPMDVYERQDSLLIEVELPGVKKEDIAVYVVGSVVTIEAEKLPDPPGKQSGRNVSYLQLERKLGRFFRELELPVTCNTHKVRAVFRHGILEIEFAKIPEQRLQRRRVPVE